MTAGFYKEDQGALVYGPNYVLHEEWQLWAEEKDFYISEGILPHEGWNWYNSEEEAKAALLPPQG